ncbi:hypothetical protein F2Q69_00005726 [Brassica cretica]|uniref:Uncharacterized protein n=1 Tax=Brassica cretica TaxID=69181 RepID=A0A8S9P6H7_BRACR|nr:hypothetical protein F2Q69_00005726 [Brassica cretica]
MSGLVPFDQWHVVHFFDLRFLGVMSRRVTSPAVCLTSPLNPMSGVILRVRALSSSPRSLYAAWKMMLPGLPLSTSILLTRQFATVSGTCPAVQEATRKLSCYSHQILQAWSVQSAKKRAPHRSTTTLVRRSIFRRPPSTQALVPSTQALVPSTNTRSPPSTEDTHFLSTDIFHPASIDTSVRTSIDSEPQDMVATLILVHDERGDLQDQEGHLRNAAGQRIDT